MLKSIVSENLTINNMISIYTSKYTVTKSRISDYKLNYVTCDSEIEKELLDYECKNFRTSINMVSEKLSCDEFSGKMIVEDLVFGFPFDLREFVLTVGDKIDQLSFCNCKFLFGIGFEVDEEVDDIIHYFENFIEIIMFDSCVISNNQSNSDSYGYLRIPHMASLFFVNCLVLDNLEISLITSENGCDKDIIMINNDIRGAINFCDTEYLNRDYRHNAFELGSLYLNTNLLKESFELDQIKAEKVFVISNVFKKNATIKQIISSFTFIANNIFKNKFILKDTIHETLEISNNKMECFFNFLVLSECRITDYFKIDFDNIHGLVSIVDNTYPDRVFVEEDFLVKNDYKQLKFYLHSDVLEEHYKLPKLGAKKFKTFYELGLHQSHWNFYNMSELLNKTSSKRIDVLRCEYEMNRCKRIRRKHNDSIDKKWSRLLDVNYLSMLLMEKTTGYFTKPESILKTSIYFMGLYTCINYYFSHYFNNYCVCVSNFERIMNSLYFSIISFTTIGYGDMYPTDAVLRIVSGIEGLIGVLLTAALITTLARRYST